MRAVRFSKVPGRQVWLHKLSFLRKYPEKQLAQIAVELGQEEHPLGQASHTFDAELAMNPVSQEV